MSFPQRSKFLKRAVGWEKLGELGTYWNEDQEKSLKIDHTICGTPLMVGKEQREIYDKTVYDVVIFKYCPRCMIKVA